MTARASRATDQAATAAKYASADVPSQTAAGARTRNGAARRASASSARARTATSTATQAVAPTVMHHIPAQPPPRSPIRSRSTKVSVAPGG